MCDRRWCLCRIVGAGRRNMNHHRHDNQKTWTCMRHPCLLIQTHNGLDTPPRTPLVYISFMCNPTQSWCCAITGPVCELRDPKNTPACPEGGRAVPCREHPRTPQSHAQLLRRSTHADQDCQALPGEPARAWFGRSFVGLFSFVHMFDCSINPSCIQSTKYAMKCI